MQVSKGTREIIDKYKANESKTISGLIAEAIELYDKYYSMSPQIFAIFEKYKNIYADELKIVEEGVRLLDKQKSPGISEDLELWCRTRDEMQMMLIGKTTFKDLLIAAETSQESLDRPLKRNIAMDVILWYTRKPIKTLSLEEIIMSIKKMWIVANYFYYIEVTKEAEDQFHLIFKHDQDKRYSNYWLRYFTEVFHSADLSFKCLVEGEAFDETLSLTIKELHKKK